MLSSSPLLRRPRDEMQQLRAGGVVFGWIVGVMACHTSREPALPRSNPSPMPSFVTLPGDVKFLSRHGSLRVLESPGGGRVAVSAKYQGRVMTSAVEPEGRSLGFVNRTFIEEGETGTQFDNYGGEDRFW